MTYFGDTPRSAENEQRQPRRALWASLAGLGFAIAALGALLIAIGITVPQALSIGAICLAIGVAITLAGASVYFFGR